MNMKSTLAPLMMSGLVCVGLGTPAAAPGDEARTAGVVAAMDVGSGGAAPDSADDAVGDDDEFVSAHVAVLGVGRNLLLARGVAIDSLGKNGVADAAAAVIAKLVEEHETAGVLVHASFATVLPLSRAQEFSRGVDFPTSTVANTIVGAPPAVGFGGYVSAVSSLRLEAREAGGGAVWVNVAYEIEEPASFDAPPPVKTSLRGGHAVRLRRGDLGVAGGRLGSGIDAGFVFVVVRLAAE